jgi:hypothetical protein
MQHFRNWGFVAFAVAVIGGVLGLHQSASATLAPSKPIARVLDPGTVSLDWDDVSGASGYELRYRDSEWNVLPHGDVSVTMEGSSAVVRSLPGSSEFAFAVRTRAAAGYRSNWSDPVYPAPLPARVSPTRVLPATPANLKVAKRERDSVTLEWQAVNSADSYQVAYWRTSEGSEDWVILPDEGIHVSIDTPGGTGAVVSRLPELSARMHDFAVRAVNAEGVSAWSEVVQAPAFLQMPQDLIGWYQAPGQVVLAWPEVPTADVYEVLFWYDLEAASEEWVVLPTDDIAVTLDGSQALVDLGANYPDRLLNFAVRAINDLSESPWSSVVAVGPVLQVPAELTGRLLENGAISLDWPDVPVVDAYEVRFLLDGSSGSQWVTLPAAGIEVSFAGSGARLEQLPHYASYFLQVRATKENSLPSDWSEVFAIARQTSRPGVVVQTTAPGGGTPSGTGTPSTDSPGDADAPPQPASAPTVGGASPSATVTEAQPTPTPRSRSRNRNSQPEPTPQPRVWLQGVPTTIKVGEAVPVTLMREGNPAEGDFAVTVSFMNKKDDGSSVVVLVAEEPEGTPPCPAKPQPHGYHESFFTSGKAYIVGCRAGSPKVEVKLSASASVSVGSSPSIKVVEAKE